MRYDFDPSVFDKLYSILSQLNYIKDYLKDNPNINVWYCNTDYIDKINTYKKSLIINTDNKNILEGDIVFFNNSYYATITGVSSTVDEFYTTNGISFKGEQGTSITNIKITEVV